MDFANDILTQKKTCFLQGSIKTYMFRCEGCTIKTLGTRKMAKIVCARAQNKTILVTYVIMYGKKFFNIKNNNRLVH